MFVAVRWVGRERRRKEGEEGQMGERETETERERGGEMREKEKGAGKIYNDTRGERDKQRHEDKRQRWGEFRHGV